MNEELKRTKFDRAFCKKIKLLVEGFSFFSLKAENWWRKWSIKRKTVVTVCPSSLNPGKAITMAICPIICSFYYLARARSCMTWRVNLHAQKDAQKWLARLSRWYQFLANWFDLYQDIDTRGRRNRVSWNATTRFSTKTKEFERDVLSTSCATRVLKPNNLQRMCAWAD